MSTITIPSRSPVNAAPTQPPPSPAFPGDQRITIRGLSWDLYDRLSDAIDPRQHIYLAYDGKDLEIMTKGRWHEHYKELFGRFVSRVTAALMIRRATLGETSWKRPEIARGLEADQCYYFAPDKLEADARARARKSDDIADYPNPDLAIEVDLSPSQIDRPSIYATLRVREIWRFDGASVVIEQLGPDGSYSPVDYSRFLPVTANDILRWIIHEDSTDELEFERRVTEWARELRRAE
jgi:Uma2 family endonuclease